MHLLGFIFPAALMFLVGGFINQVIKKLWPYSQGPKIMAISSCVRLQSPLPLDKSVTGKSLSITMYMQIGAGAVAESHTHSTTRQVTQ